MEISPGDLVDRYTILNLKAMRIKNSDVSGELIEVQNALSKYEVKTKWVEALFKANRAIWDLEAEIRQGKEKKLGLEEVGRRALKIRDWNARRVAIKNKINEHFGRFREVKVDHASAN